MDIMENARELGRMIANSDEMLNFRIAEADVLNDKAAKSILEAGLEDEIFKNTKAKVFLDSKDKLDKLLKDVSEIISHSLTGGEELLDFKKATCEKASGCSGGCCGKDK
jgi:cell fate (sporulation/competence/biofilm development) regulator YlbF (YheA/YmcA/DUF963 family)